MIEVERINGHPRYKIIKMAENYYVIEQDKPILLLSFFSFLRWLIPFIAYQITEGERDSIMDRTSKKYSKEYMAFSKTIMKMAIPIGLIFVSVTNGIYYNFEDSTAYVLLLLAFIVCLYIRFIVIASKPNEEINKIKQKNKRVKMMIRPTSLKFPALFLLGCGIFLSGSLFAIYLFLENGDLISLAGFIVCVCIYFVMIFNTVNNDFKFKAKIKS